MPVVLPTKYDKSTARSRFKRHVTSGFFRPAELSGDVTVDAKSLFIAVHVYRFDVSSNWTAESGRKSGNAIKWTPLSGQHSGRHVVPILASKPPVQLMYAVKANFGDLSEATTPDQEPDPDAIAPSQSTSSTLAIASKELSKLEKAACGAMVPGHVRNVRVNSTVSEPELSTVLMPYWDLTVSGASGLRVRGFVDAYDGRVYGSRPTNWAKVAAVVGGVVAILLVTTVGVFGFGTAGTMVLALVAGNASQQQADEQARVDAARAKEDLERAKAAHQASLEDFAQSKADLESKVAAAESVAGKRDTKEARAALDQISAKLMTLHEALPEETTSLWKRFHACSASINHIEQVSKGIAEATAVVADKVRCDTPSDIAAAWADLKEVHVADPERSAAVSLAAKLEKCRLQCGKSLAAGVEAIMVDQRLGMAEKMERTFLDGGLDVDVTVSGKNKDAIKFTNVLMGKVWAHKMTEGGSMAPGSFLRNLQSAGFRKVVFYDGYDESYSYELTPESHPEAGAEILSGVGLRDAIVMPLFP